METSLPGQRLRVLAFVPTPPPYGGPEISAELLLASDLTKYFDVCHVRANFSEDNQSKGALSIRKAVSGARCFSGLADRVLRFRPHILYTNLSQNRLGLLRDAIVVTVARLGRAKVVMHLRGSSFRDFSARAPWLDRRVAGYVAGRVHTFVVLADALRNQFEIVRPNGYRVRAVYNAVDAERLLPGVQSFEDLVTHRRRSDEGPRVLFVGYQTRNKGYYDLLAAIPEVLKRVPRAQFLAAGDELEVDRIPLYGSASGGGPAAAEAAEKIRAGASHIRRCGVVWGADKTALFMNADVFVLPSYTEGMPMALLEAFAAGLPAVTTPVGAIPEIVRDGVNGFLVNPGEPSELARALVRLLEDPALREGMGRTNFALARDRFHPRRVAAGMRDVFAQVAGE